MEQLIKSHSFTIDGVPYSPAKPLQITTPELGSITIDKWDFELISTPTIVSFNLGWIKTPLACGKNAPNATLRLVSKRIPPVADFKPYTSDILTLSYHCKCKSEVHSRSLQWYCSLNGHLVKTDKKGWDQYHSTVHNHPIVEAKPLQKPVEAAKETAKTNSKGQFQLF